MRLRFFAILPAIIGLAGLTSGCAAPALVAGLSYAGVGSGALGANPMSDALGTRKMGNPSGDHGGGNVTVLQLVSTGFGVSPTSDEADYAILPLLAPGSKGKTARWKTPEPGSFQILNDVKRGGGHCWDYRLIVSGVDGTSTVCKTAQGAFEVDKTAVALKKTPEIAQKK